MAWTTPNTLAEVLPVARGWRSGTHPATKYEQVIDENHELIHASGGGLAVVPEFDERN